MSGSRSAADTRALLALCCATIAPLLYYAEVCSDAALRVDLIGRWFPLAFFGLLLLQRSMCL